eukprot:COSAG06_NODE_30256_length_542_cov_0.688488_1_plen_65_part_01
MFGSCCYHSLLLLFVHYVDGSQGLRTRGSLEGRQLVEWSRTGNPKLELFFASGWLLFASVWSGGA